MNKIVIITFFISIFFDFAYCQAPSILPSSGNRTWCPGETLPYEVLTSGVCNYSWSVSNGQIVGSTTSSKVSVIWNDSPSTGTLKVTLTNCTEATNTSVSETYAIRSLAGRVPANAIALQQLPYCSTTPVVLIM